MDGPYLTMTELLTIIALINETEKRKLRRNIDANRKVTKNS